jgi:uncharacterized protein (DUF1015 family)
MALIEPFAALRPEPSLAAKICELPYDVMSSAEARRTAAGNPLSFLHVSKPEIDLPENTGLYTPQVYAKGKENFERLLAQGALRYDARPSFYLYRQIMGGHSQTGLVAAASCEDYLRGVVKKHEFTRPDKEDDRVRHIETLDAQTGPVFLVYRDAPALKDFFLTQAASSPEVDFTAPDGVRHSAWVLDQPAEIQWVRTEFEKIPALYIADGHHRCAAAGRIYRSRKGAGRSAFFLSVIFPHDQVQILPYNRALSDLNGLAPGEVLERLEAIFIIQSPGCPQPSRKHEVGFYLAGQWRTLHFRPHFVSTENLFEKLDVTLLQKFVFAPIFGIDDPRTSQRIQFVGGIRGTDELEKLVDSGQQACAFSLFPTRIEDLMAISDAGGTMPPKSTWFEPKLRDGMFCHRIE